MLLVQTLLSNIALMLEHTAQISRRTNEFIAFLVFRHVFFCYFCYSHSPRLAVVDPCITYIIFPRCKWWENWILFKSWHRYSGAFIPWNLEGKLWRWTGYYWWHSCGPKLWTFSDFAKGSAMGQSSHHFATLQGVTCQVVPNNTLLPLGVTVVQILGSDTPSKLPMVSYSQ